MTTHPRLVTVVLADDHPLYREGVAGAIQQRPDLRLLGEADSGDAALELIREKTPDVALLDVKMDGGGLSVLKAVASEQLPTRVVLLSAHLDSALVHKALEDGAAAYVSKRSDRDEICDAIRAAASGETVLSREVQQVVADGIRSQRDARREVLSARQREILLLAADGLSTAEIGARLHLSQATIKTHLANSYERLDVSDRTAAVAQALRLGLFD